MEIVKISKQEGGVYEKAKKKKPDPWFAWAGITQYTKLGVIIYAQSTLWVKAEKKVVELKRK